MGQDTYGNIGVSVTLDLIYQNIELLRRLLADQDNDQSIIKCFVHPSYCDCDDEIEDLECLEDLDLETLLESQTQEEFETHLETIGERQIHFFIETCSAYARNISRRNHPYIFGNEGSSVETVIKSFEDAKQRFLALGVPSDLVTVGYTLLDSY
jgi:hypothetical protein